MPHVRYAAVLEAPADKVWDMVRDFGSLPRWFPFVVSSDLSGGPYEVGAVRTNHIQDGTTIVERLTEISEHERRVVYDVIGGDATMSNYTACLSVAEVSDTDRTFVQWTGHLRSPERGRISGGGMGPDGNLPHLPGRTRTRAGHKPGDDTP